MQEEERPHISVNAQYIKDFSFENPKAPHSINSVVSTPKVDLALDIYVNKMEEEDVYEVALHIEAKTMQESGEVLFAVELLYAGVFTLQNIPKEQYKFLLSVHCPSLLFPFARKIIASVTQDGGFQPLMMDPIDFGMLFHKKMMEEEESEVIN